jgi:hypothetical protein
MIVVVDICIWRNARSIAARSRQTTAAPMSRSPSRTGTHASRV